MKQLFPIFKSYPNLVYLDNGATTQKPQSVIDAISIFYSNSNSNIHRGVYHLSQKATEAYEGARKKVAEFIHASEDEIIFTKGTTESINLVAQTYGKSQLKKGDEILITEMEHHANIVPWQLLCEETGAILKVLPITDTGELEMSQLDKFLTKKTKLVSIVHISNTLGTINDVETIIEAAHNVGAVTLIDGAQAIAHQAIDVKTLDADFYVFSGHKMYGPTGIGVLYGKKELLDAMPPYQGGGDMIESVTFEKTTYREAPFRFEAGTPPIAQAIGLGSAIDFIESIGFETIGRTEKDLLEYATSKLEKIKGLKIIGTADNKAGIISFVLDGVHPHDAGTLLDQEGVAIRTGHHCTQPIMKRFKVPATSRASFAVYNTTDDVDKLVTAILKTIETMTA